jgi:hypothetical protein
MNRLMEERRTRGGKEDEPTDGGEEDEGKRWRKT